MYKIPAGMVSEAAIEREIVVFLRGKGFFVAKIPNDALYKCNVSNVVKGMPDLIAISPKGVLYFLEVKRPGGKVRPAQKAVHRTLREYGQRVKIVRGLSDLSDLLEDDELAA